MKGYADKGLGTYEKLIMRLISTILIAAVFNMFISDAPWENISYVDYIDSVSFIIAAILVFLLLTAVSLVYSRFGFKNTDAVIFAAAAICMGFYMLTLSRDVYMSVIVVFLCLTAVRYVLMRFPAALGRFNLSERKLWIIFGIVMAATLLYVGSLVVLRYYLFRTPTFDFGIFSQMFYYMKETGLPITTCERDCYLSHFAIHFSPVFYLLLPVYMIFPHPVTLIAAQLIIVMSGVIPIYFMCRNKKYSNLLTLGLMLVFVLYPTMRSGLFYDFHENKFLPPLLLWLIYFMEAEGIGEKKKNIGTAVFALMSLMVKEDAAIYVACIGLFRLVSGKTKKDKIRGAVVAAAAVVYFLVVFYCLMTFGKGSSINSIGRYDNLMTSETKSLAGMLLNILKNPAYAVKQLLTDKKLEFVIWTMLPLLFLPLFAKKLSMYILLIPYMVMNLLTNYGYQFDIGFQYTFGSCTLLIYMALVWFEGAQTLKKKRCIVLMVIAAFLLSTNSIAGKNAYYEEAGNVLQKNMEVMELFDTIPEDASVTAETWFVPALSQRKEIYEYSEKGGHDTEFLVLDMRYPSNREKYNKLAEKLMAEGYAVFGEIEEKVLILRKIG